MSGNTSLKHEDHFLFRPLTTGEQSGLTGQYDYQLPEPTAGLILELTHGNASGLYVCVLAALSILLQKHTQQDRIIIDSPALLPSALQQGTNAAIALAVEDAITLRQHLNNINGTLKKTYSAQGAGSYLQQTNVMLAYPAMHAEAESGGYDLVITIVRNGNRIKLLCSYDLRFFTKLLISQLFEQLTHMFSCYRQLDIPVSNVTLLDATGRQRVIHGYNQTFRALPTETTIVSLFEKQVAQSPDAIAVAYGDHTLTYAALNKAANRLARHLISHYHVAAGDIIGIMTPPADLWIIAMLAVLKSGAAYLPVDIDLPEKRKEWLLSDAGIKLLLTDAIQFLQQELQGYEVFLLDSSLAGLTEPDEDLSVSIAPESSAYVIYTSGTTGVPKGVVIAHAGLFNMVQCQIREFGIRGTDKVLQFASVSFDAAVSEIGMAICAGAQLVMADRSLLKDHLLFPVLLQQYGITVLTLPPSYLSVFAPEVFNTLRVIISAGEKLNTAAALQLSGHKDVFNAYGPTEGTVCTTIHKIAPGMSQEEAESIGVPIDNVQVYILDNHLQVLPDGIAGNIYIGGAGLALGYLHLPELTATKFISAPGNDIPGERLYDTGDMGKWLPGGKILYMGRRDDQVKIRGHRVEPAEVATVIMQSGNVRQCEVMAIESADGNRKLVAFVVPVGAFDQESMTDYAAARLPQYMLPAIWKCIAAIPLTDNGKADRKALLDMEQLPTATVDHDLPGNALEERLAIIWQAILEITPVSVTADFFHLGGDSLQAIRVLSAIREQFAVQLSINDLFKYTSIRSLADHMHTIDAVAPEIDRSISTVRPALLPLSYGQQRLWITHQLMGSTHYHLPVILRLSGELDVHCLEQAIRSIVDRHEVLRTVYQETNGMLCQEVKAAGNWQFDHYGTLPEGEILEARTTAFINRPFTLTEDHMIRAILIRLSDEEYQLIAVMHHIAADGWSVPILIRELRDHYQALKTGSVPTLPPLPLQYADYAVWQRSKAQQALLHEQLSYWKQQLQGMQQLELPLDHPRPSILQTAGNVLHFQLAPALKQQAEQWALREEATLFMALQAVFDVLLYRYNGQEDICTGTVVAGRGQQLTEAMVGFFVNMLVIRVQLVGNETFRDVLQQVKARTLEAFANQDIPFEQVADSVSIIRDNSRHPLFQAAFILQNLPPAPPLALDGLQVQREEPVYTTSKFDICFEIIDTTLRVEYNTALFEEDTIRRLVAHYERLLQAAVAFPQQQIQQADMLQEADMRQLLLTFNNTAHDFPHDRTIIDLFEAEAAGKPEKTILVFKDRRYTYKELQTKVNRLAGYLYTHFQASPNKLVGVQLGRGEWQIISLLAILKTGAAYIPIDPDTLVARMEQIVADSQCIVVINEEVLQHFFAEKELYQDVVLSPGATPDNLIYVIYTSGSTGVPKGVMMQHSGVMNRLAWMWEQYGFSETDVILQKTSFTFDVSVWEIFMPLCMGARLVLCEQEDVVSPQQIRKLINKHGISCLHFVPGMFDAFIHTIFTGEQPGMESLRLVFTSGEALRADAVQRWYKHMHAVVHNLYGPTEAAVDVTYYVTTATDTRIPIGRPIWNTAIRILNPAGGLAPIGGIGEIGITGAGLARGYLNNPVLTALKFIADPFAAGNLLYKTGDYGRWLADGNIEFLGRRDGQVKIRGYRIETGEIEAAINQLPYITACTVVAKPDAQGQPELVAYVVSDSRLDVTMLRVDLSNLLPAYMLPAHYVQLTQIPLTASGKIDKKQLPDPQGYSLAGNHLYTPPNNKTETQLVSIWQTVLGSDRVGTADNFFELGGNSIKLIRMVGMIREAFNIDLPVVKAFGLPTINALADFLQDQRATTAAIEDAPEEAVGIMKESLLLINKFHEE